MLCWITGYVDRDISGYAYDASIYPTHERSRSQHDASGWRMTPGYTSCPYGEPTYLVPPPRTVFGNNNAASKSFHLLTSPVSPAYGPMPHDPFYGWEAFPSPSSWGYHRSPPLSHVGSSTTSSRQEMPPHIPHNEHPWHQLDADGRSISGRTTYRNSS